MSGQFIYKIINIVNGKFYVGSTTNPKIRFRVHRKRLRKNQHHCHHLQFSWNKHGEAVFVFHVVETVPEEQSLQEAEDRWLIEHVGKPHCYNIGLRSGAPWRGGPKEDHPNFGRPKTQEEKQAISATLKAFYAKDIANHPRFGKQHTEETKELIRQKKLANPSRAWLGKERSVETKEKISESQKGKQKAPGRKVSEEGLVKIRANIKAGKSHKHWLGRKHTEESRAKMSKPVFVKPDGILFPSLTLVLQHYGIKMPTLNRALKSGKPLQKGKLVGYAFSYGDPGLAENHLDSSVNS